MGYRKTLFIIITVAFLLRLAAYSYFASLSIRPEPWEYEDIARNIAAGNGFQNVFQGVRYYSCTPPLYPYICALIYKLFSVNHIIVIAMQVLASLLICILIFDLGRRIADETVGSVASFLYAIHPAFILYSVIKLHPLILDSLFLALTLWAFIYLHDSLNSRRSLLTGLVAGLCILTRSTIVGFLPLALLWLLAVSKNKIKLALRSILLIFAGILIVVSPWIIRNLAVHKEPMLTISTDTMAFWRGNNPHATGTSYTSSGVPILKDYEEVYDKIVTMSELEQRSFFKKEALKFIREHPGKAMELFFRKLYYFWWFSPSAGLLYPGTYLIVYKYMYGITVILFLIGLYSAIRQKVKVRRNILVLALLFLISISAFQSLFYVDGRHRWGIEPVFIIIAAMGIVSIFQNRAYRKRIPQK